MDIEKLRKLAVDGTAVILIEKKMILTGGHEGQVLTGCCPNDLTPMLANEAVCQFS
ncbi:MAG: hypothetical protein MUO31_02440 [Thermodesulfovibrionales bacterium]|nr:hypothetical protein [Thermodesulfovibrionales bacterium]